MKRKIGIVVFILLFLAVGALVYFGRQKEISETPCFSGTIESTSSNLAFQVGGKISALYADEGDSVKKEMVIAEIDPSLFQATYKKAQANVDQARKNLDRLQILLEVYAQTLPAEVNRAEAGVKSATAVFEEAKRDKDRYENLKKTNVATQRDFEKAHLGYKTAGAKLDEAKAVVAQARSNLKKIELTREEIHLAQTQYQAALAAAEFAGIQMDHTRLKAPFDGTITIRSMEPGEVVTPGQEVMTLTDLETVELKIFIGEKQIGKVAHGDKAKVKIDTYPDRIYEGTVSFISPEAEFTPKIIQTHKERVKLVFMAKIRIPNPDHSFKPGMPADACF